MLPLPRQSVHAIDEFGAAGMLFAGKRQRDGVIMEKRKQVLHFVQDDAFQKYFEGRQKRGLRIAEERVYVPEAGAGGAGWR